jgi:hypothetical protein
VKLCNRILLLAQSLGREEKHAFSNTPDAKQELDRQQTRGSRRHRAERLSSKRFLLLHRCHTGANFLPVKRAHFAPLTTAMAGRGAHMTLSEEMRTSQISKVSRHFAGCAEPVFPVCVSSRHRHVSDARCVVVSLSPHFEMVDVARSFRHRAGS